VLKRRDEKRVEDPMRESLKLSKRFERACLIWLPHCELHRGQRPIPAAIKAGHMTATDPSTKNVQQNLDPQEPSTHDN
jgi:hypothetical protein